MTDRRADRALAALFSDGEIRLDETGDGWEGFRRAVDGDGDADYFYVDTRPHVPPVRQEIRVGERAVRETVRERLGDEPPTAVADGGER